MSDSSSSNYRRDIDGLRGLSVLFVVLFHATGSLRGGFIGVDVFFVISGFLITGIFLREMEAGTFRLADFWERRIRRIMPAAAVMAFVSLLLASLILLPADLMAFGKSLIAYALMGSNIYFRHDSGYFAAAADEKPLLHTWSLSVEEQFYLLFPFLCFALAYGHRRLGVKVSFRSFFLIVFSVMMVTGLLLSVWMVRQDQTMAFYLLPSRFWELLVGSCLACLPLAWRSAPHRLSQIAAMAGVLLIVVCGIQLRDSMPFPGLLALPPCLGAALLIWAFDPAQKNTANFWLRKLMECRFFVGLGLISYSLYLWHWPLLALWEYTDAAFNFNKSLNYSAKLSLMIVALGMSYLSWRWVENVFRHKREKNRLSVSVFGYATLSIMSLCGLGWVIDSTAGWQGRWTAASLRSLVSQKEKYLYAPPKGNDLLRELINGSVPRLGSVAVEAPMHVLIWGDSHAQSLVPALDASCTRRGLAGLWVSFGSTPPLLDYTSPSPFRMKERIPTVGEAVLKLVKERQVAHVLLVAQWQTYWSEHAKKGTLPIFKSALEKTIQRLLAETHAQVWLVKDVPVHEINIPRALALHSAWPWALPDPTKLVSGREKHLVRNAEFDVFADTLKSIGAGLFDASTLLIDADGRCLIEENGKPLYFDNNHLSVLGAARLAPTFNALFQTEDKP